MLKETVHFIVFVPHKVQCSLCVICSNSSFNCWTMWLSLCSSCIVNVKIWFLCSLPSIERSWKNTQTLIPFMVRWSDVNARLLVRLSHFDAWCLPDLTAGSEILEIISVEEEEYWQHKHAQGLLTLTGSGETLHNVFSGTLEAERRPDHYNYIIMRQRQGR